MGTSPQTMEFAIKLCPKSTIHYHYFEFRSKKLNTAVQVFQVTT